MKTLTTLLLLLSTTAIAGPKLYVFDCGALYLDDVALFNLKADETAVRELFVPCYVIEHGKDLLLWDGGLPLSAAQAGHRVPVDGGSMAYKRSIIDQLADMNIEPADIEYAAYSHLHFDHVGAANAFAGSNVIMQKAEWDAAFGKGAAFLDTTLFAKLKDARLTIIDGDYDVFGDGSVKLIFAPAIRRGTRCCW